MKPIKMSALALDYFTNTLNDVLRFDMIELHDIKDCRELYFRPETIIKSSVGEFYDKNMEFFFKTAQKLCLYINENMRGTYSEVDLVSLVYSILPLATLSERDSSDINANDFVGYNTLHYYEGQTGVLPEIVSLLKEVSKYSKFECPEDHTKYYKDKVNNLEKAAYAFCARYAPQVDVAEVTRVLGDSAFLSEYMLAEIIYPWGTQPLKQLRMLIPSVPRDMRISLMKDYVGDLSVKGYPHPGNGFDVGYSFVYDILSDFSSYRYFKKERSEYPSNFKRQFWTPFFGFNIHQAFSDIKDNSLRNDIESCIKKSHILYTEILKTVGLSYEAQYAVLQGYRGRFCMSSNLFGMLDTLDILDSYEKTNMIPKNTMEIVDVIKKDIISSTPFVKESGILDRYKNRKED